MNCLKLGFKLMSTSAKSTGPIESVIRSKIEHAFTPALLDIQNDSGHHAHHASMRGSSNIIESHFRLTIISKSFENKTKPARHRMVYQLLDDELKMDNGVHALQLTLRTPEEEKKRNDQ